MHNNEQTINWLREIKYKYIHGGDEAFDLCRKEALDIAIKALEEKPQGAWIPVSERLPERNKEVIVTDIETKDTYCSWYHGNGYWECDNGVLKNRIIAWQPLPEPYRNEVKNEDC